MWPAVVITSIDGQRLYPLPSLVYFSSVMRYVANAIVVWMPLYPMTLSPILPTCSGFEVTLTSSCILKSLSRSSQMVAPEWRRLLRPTDMLFSTAQLMSKVRVDRLLYESLTRFPVCAETRLSMRKLPKSKKWSIQRR